MAGSLQAEVERRASRARTVVSKSLGSGTLSLCGEWGCKGRDLLGRRKLSPAELEREGTWQKAETGGTGTSRACSQ